MSEEKETFIDIFLKGEFTSIYIEKIVPIITSSFLNCIKNKKYEDFLIHSEKEIRVKNFFNLFNQFNTILSDLEKTIIFLNIENHQQIEKVFPKLEKAEDYYTYFIENYLIRINSLSDVLGKILNLIYKTEIEKANLYLFRNKIQQDYPALNELILHLSEKIRVTKEKRHEKLHDGTTEFEYFKNIVFWVEIHKLIKEETPEILVDQTQENINKMILTIEHEIIGLIDICREILNLSSKKLENYIEEN